MDFSSQLEIFDPKSFDKRIDVIGVGALGSITVYLLGKTGFGLNGEIHVWDYDKVEAHNIPNQLFFLEHIGEPKVQALAKILKKIMRVEIIQHNEKVGEEKREFGEIVFLLIDTMEGRKTIWENQIRLNKKIRLLIEARIGSDVARVYSVDPCRGTHIKGWQKCWYPGEGAKRSVCGNSISIASTASLTASIAVWQLIKWWNTKEVENEVIISARPSWQVLLKDFDK